MEIAALGRHLARAAGGRGGLVAIEGPAGIGKSRLLAHARERATSGGWRVLDTRCTPMSTTINSCLLRDWFGTLAHRVGAGVHPFDGPGQVLAELTDGSGRGIGDLVYGARWVLEDLTTDQPVLLMVDDVQWADANSLHALDLLVNAIQHLPCLIVYAVRTGEVSAAPEALARIQQSSRILAPAPLSAAAVGTLLAEVDPHASPEEVTRIHDATGGVPFFVRELIADNGGGDTPESVVGSVAGRLSRLSPTATTTARAICVLGSQATLGMVAELSGQALDTVADDIAALASAQVLALDAGHLTVRHPLIAQAVLAHMSASEAAELHRRTAELLVRRGAPRAVVANHLLQTMPAGNREATARLTEQGEHALAGGTHEMAVRYLARAVAEGPIGADGIPLLSSLARAHAGLGHFDEALACWEQAESLTADPDTLAELRAESGDALVMAGRHREAQVAFGSLIDASNESPAQQRLVARMVMAGFLTGMSVSQMRQQVDRVMAQPQHVDTYEDRLSLSAGAVLKVFECEGATEARELALRAAGDGVLLQEETSEGTALYMCTGALSWSSAYDESEALLTAAVEDAQVRSSSMAFATASSCRGYARMRMGLITEAVIDFEAALEQRSQGWNAYLAMVLAGLVECRIARGELEHALSYTEELEGLGHTAGMGGAFATAALGDLAEAAGDHERAAQLYAEVGRLVADRMDNPAVLAWRSGHALALIRLGQGREAAIQARENTARAKTFGAPYAVAQALRTQAAVDPAVDRLGLLREALEVLEVTRAQRLEAQIATDLAGMVVLLHGTSETDDVVGLLRKAEALAGFQELRPLGDRVQRLLERIGEPVHRSTSDAVNLLTVSERRVADLAASGMSNRQIAQQLFVTVKAVEWHLSNVYRKLGIRSRTRLPAVLAVPSQRHPPGVEVSAFAT